MSPKTELAGPGIGTYEEVERILPANYRTVLNPKETQGAITLIKHSIETGLSQELNLARVTVPLIVEKESGVNDNLDRDGSRTPVEFVITNDHGKHPVNAQVVQAATKWKRLALKQFNFQQGEGLWTDMHAVRKDYFLDHDHSAYVDQWDWELSISEKQRNLEFLKSTVTTLWQILKSAEEKTLNSFPQLKGPVLPEKLTFIHAEELYEKYPNLSRKERETRILKELQAVFLIGIGWPLGDGNPHELRASDYDDWVTPTVSRNGQNFHGLNGDILVWNPITQRRHELSSMGIRVTAESLKKQLDLSNQNDLLEMPYHQKILNDEVPLSIGGGIGQSRTYMLLLKKAHIGEVSVTVWPQHFRKICEEKNIQLL